ncbi:transcriptional regulator [Mesorhizobium plurifarium]|nr:transcriptional regulator [Mesorhizobium plurifarium]
MVELTGASQPNVSNHLRKRNHDLVESEKRGRLVIYRVASPAVAEVIASCLRRRRELRPVQPCPRRSRCGGRELATIILQVA